ncbi:hypothetical protein ACJMK2_010315 [Sinanodonta woodiana]|uniref:MD-2-related lipid-recognition domain-containing protein n=1 Tax=Sinanodonta woodiana TaxID=1069815 RepID=A0ABD3VEZ1_SINWO
MNSRKDGMKNSAFFLVLCGVVCLISCGSSKAASQDESLRYRSCSDDPGHVENCGSANMNITWLPKELDPRGSLTINISYIFPEDFDQGTLDLAIKISGMEFRNTFALQCSYLQKVMPSITCPARKNQIIKGSYTISDLSKLSRYPGPLEAVIKGYNSDKQELCCGIVKTVIKG